MGRTLRLMLWVHRQAIRLVNLSVWLELWFRDGAAILAGGEGYQLEVLEGEVVLRKLEDDGTRVEVPQFEQDVRPHLRLVVDNTKGE